MKGTTDEVRDLKSIVEEEIEIDSETLPGARKAFEQIRSDLLLTWPQINHQTGGSVIKLERMFGSEHVIVTCDADANVSTNLFASSRDNTHT